MINWRGFILTALSKRGFLVWKDKDKIIRSLSSWSLYELSWHWETRVGLALAKYHHRKFSQNQPNWHCRVIKNDQFAIRLIAADLTYRHVFHLSKMHYFKVTQRFGLSCTQIGSGVAFECSVREQVQLLCVFKIDLRAVKVRK